ncbi:CD225/dispanin family protein [Mycobacterium sp. CBMA271]|uniref:CD225/dispanin family protein n=1 Tax=unclassified Mycobacteroides TaxID=2618759 RepID=UPI0012DDCE42|nr:MULTISPECIES: CD225/dispanin family protein [unclassified Mycobacteroides]MUM19121.1 hypothetical protein [Mycobacteroides sp. CBMA 326]MUM21535.1 CD225/dispanin family protein [Mycobacteroides sp. CBMA 271]
MTDETSTDTPTTPSTPPPAPTSPGGPPKPPPTNVGWAVAAVVFFWPLAFSAFTNALNVTQFWLTGQYDRAQESSDRAKLLGKIALLTGLVLLFLFIAARIACAIWWHTHGGGGGGGHHGWDRSGDDWDGPGMMGRPGRGD